MGAPARVGGTGQGSSIAQPGSTRPAGADGVEAARELLGDRPDVP